MMLVKKILVSLGFLSLLTAPILLNGCGRSNFSYNDSQREELTASSKLIVEAVATGTERVHAKKNLDFVEGRKGFSSKIESSVSFRLKRVVKGTAAKEVFSVGINLPSMAFGMGPGESPGMKKFTLYFAYDQKIRRDVLLGAEWEKVR